jgi:signal peptidase I
VKVEPPNRGWAHEKLAWLQWPFSKPFQVANRSMLPTLSQGDRVLVNRIAYRLRLPRRGEIIVLRHPESGGDTIKRLVGLPGERVALENGALYVDEERVSEPYLSRDLAASTTLEWVLGPSEYIVLGDNRAESRDSRQFGPVSRKLLRGPVWYRY